jgi:hypothetical protein
LSTALRWRSATRPGKVRKPHGAVKATLTVVFKRSGSTDVTVKRAVKLT